MRRKMSIFLITEIIVLSCVSRCASQMFNLTQFLERSFLPRVYEAQLPRNVRPQTVRVRDISYLPEEFNEDTEEAEETLQQVERNDRNLMPEYRSLCEIKTKKVQLSDSDYEYQPPSYHEVYCNSYSFVEQAQPSPKLSKQKCAHPGFHCVQRSRTLFVVRRRWDSDCWEPMTREIASGCDCMWPISILGDISAHY